MPCPIVPRCPFFNNSMSAMPTMLRKRYCDGDHTACARFMACAALAREGVPNDLWPNQHDRLPTLGVS